MSRSFSFTYFPFPFRDPKDYKIKEVFRPTVPIKIGFGKKVSFAFQALVDSGSDRNLFPASIGEITGLNIRKGVKLEIMGIGRVKIISFTHEVTLYIEKCTFDVEIDFSYDQEVPLLGRNGFFSLFKRIDFKEKKKVISFKV